MRSDRPQGRLRLVTALDAALVVSTAAALVIALGGRTRVVVAGVPVVLRTTTNFIIAAVALGLLRLLLGRGLRPLPAVPPPDPSAIERERARFRSPTPITPEVLLLGMATLLGSIVWIVPHLLHPRWVPDAGDPVFSAWRIARLTHQLITDPRHLFDGNIFYPLPLTLTMSDSTFLEGLLGAPFILAGADPLIVANGLTMAAFPLCGLAFFYAGWRLTGDPYAAVAGGLLGAWYPFHSEHYSHLELQWFMFAPLAVVGALRMLTDPRPRTGLLFGAAVALQWLASMYLGIMLLAFLVPFILMVAAGWRVLPSRKLLIAAAGAAAVALPAFAGLAWPYLEAQDIRGERGRAEVRMLSATPENYGDPHGRLVAYLSSNRRNHKVERELFPGTSTLVLAAIGMVPPLGAAAVGTVAAGALTFDWSLGLNGLTYDDLYKRLSVFRGMRVPARFSAILGAGLALLGSIGAARLLRLARRPGARAGLCGAMALMILFDLRMSPGIGAYPEGLPPIYASVSPSMVLVEMPANRPIDYMYFSTWHWARMLGGYSGFIKYSDALMRGYEAWPAPASIDLFRSAGATHLTYNCAFERSRPRCANTLDQLDANPALELVASGRWQGQETRLYRIR
jgi:hypothetical protein